MILFFFSFPDVTLYVVVKDGYILNTEKSRSDFMCSQIALTSIWFREATTSKVHSEFVKGFLSLRFVDVSGAEGIQLQNDHTPVSFTKTRLVAHKKALGEVCHSRSQGPIQGEPLKSNYRDLDGGPCGWVDGEGVGLVARVIGCYEHKISIFESTLFG